MVKATFVHYHMCTHRTVNGVDVFNVLFYIRAFVIISFQIRSGHKHNVGVHFHKKSHHLFFADKICTKVFLLFFKIKNIVVRVVCYIVNDYVWIIQNIVDNSFKVFVKSAVFGINHKVFVFNGEKAFVVPFFSFIKFGATLRRVCSANRRKLFKFLFAFFKSIVINIFFRIHYSVQN